MIISPRRAVLLFVCLLPLAASLSAQVITATLSGSVTDPSGGLINKAKVTARNLDTNLTREAQTDSDGRYLVPFLPVGRYSLTVEAAGFKTLVKEPIELTVNQTASVDASLSIGQTSDTVTVSGDANLIQTETSQIGGVVGTTRIIELPLNGRNVLQLVQLLPGAALVSTSQAFATARFGPSLVINGSRSNENGIYLDGSLYMDLFRGTGLNLPPPDHMQEFRAITAGFDAEYGRVPGSIINAVTKSGGNGFHGVAYEFLRNNALNARRFFDATVPILKQNQFGGTIGGPVIKNKLFFFFGYEGLRVRPAASGTAAFVPTALQ
jgi:hypothetical protein